MSAGTHPLRFKSKSVAQTTVISRSGSHLLIRYDQWRRLWENSNKFSPFFPSKNQNFHFSSQNMTTNAAEKTLRSEVHGHVNQNMDAVTASSGSGEAGEDRVNPRSVRPQQAVQEGL